MAATAAADASPQVLDAAWLRHLCLGAGADDVGFIGLDRRELTVERSHILQAFPPTRSVISFVVRMNRDNVRSPARSIANKEFHSAGDAVDDVAREITSTLERLGIRALNPPIAFPMEAGRWMAGRAKAQVVEVPGSHAIYVSKPAEIAKLIQQAADARA